MPVVCACAGLGASGCGQRSSAARAPSAGITAVSGNGSVQSAGSLPADPGSVRSLIQGTSAQMTRPTITPRQGGPSTVFVLRLTSRSRLGVRGVLNTEYRVSSAGPSAPGCVGAVARTIHRGEPGQRLRIVLGPAAVGWCRGKYRGMIDLLEGPYCRHGAGGAKGILSRPCPVFAIRLLEVGQFRWRVR